MSCFLIQLFVKRVNKPIWINNGSWLLHWLSRLHRGQHFCVLHILKLIHLSDTLGLKEIHFHESFIRFIICNLFLFLKNQVVKIYFITTDCKIILSWERLQVLHAISAENYILYVFYNVIL